MVSLGRPGVGEAFLTDAGFEPEERFVVPFFMEYADPDSERGGALEELRLVTPPTRTRTGSRSPRRTGSRAPRRAPA